jgi:hypothetical protein
VKRTGGAIASVVVAAVVVLSIACGSSSSSGPPKGPGGAYAVDSRCSPYLGDLCSKTDAVHPNFFQCDVKPGDPCVPAPQASPDPDQTVWCCTFPCARADPAQDYRCGAGGGTGALYVCTDAKFDPGAYGCKKGPDSTSMCC